MAARRGEEGQMLLLTAIILAIGFIALASLASRIDQIPEEAEQVQEGLFFDEVELVVDAVGLAMDGLAGDYSYANMGTSGFQDELDDMFAHMAHVERAHGYLVSIGAVSCSSGDLEVMVDIASYEQEVSVLVSRSYTGTC